MSRRRSRSIEIYLKEGIEEDDLIRNAWTALRGRGRPQDVFRRVLLHGIRAMLEAGEMPRAAALAIDVGLLPPLPPLRGQGPAQPSRADPASPAFRAERADPASPAFRAERADAPAQVNRPVAEGPGANRSGTQMEKPKQERPPREGVMAAAEPGPSTLSGSVDRSPTKLGRLM